MGSAQVCTSCAQVMQKKCKQEYAQGMPRAGTEQGYGVPRICAGGMHKACIKQEQGYKGHAQEVHRRTGTGQSGLE